MALEMHHSLTMPAGVWLKEAFLIPENIKVTALAEGLGITRQALTAVLNGRSAMTPSLAVKLEKALGIKARMLMDMQTSYELAQAREREKAFPIERLNAAAPKERERVHI